MRLPILTNALICLPLLALLPSCSGGTDTSVSAESSTLSRERFTAADRAAARALSIGDSGALEREGPYVRALLCNKAIEAVTAQLANLRALNTEQLNQLQQAQAVFGRRLRQAAAQEGKSPADIQRDLNGPVAEGSETADQGRVAVACLQSMQPAT